MGTDGEIVDQALEFYVEGLRAHDLLNPRANRDARLAFKEAIRIRPDYARAHGYLSYSLLIAWMNDWKEKDSAEDLDVDMPVIGVYAENAVKFGGSDYDNHWSKANALAYAGGDHSAAIAVFDHALLLAKNQATPVNYSNLRVERADALMFGAKDVGEIDAAISETKEALKTPRHPKSHLWTLGWAYYEKAYYEDMQTNCVLALEALLQFSKPDAMIRKNIIACYVSLGWKDAAKALAREFQKSFPNYSVSNEDKWPYGDKSRLDRFKSDLAVAFSK